MRVSCNSLDVVCRRVRLTATVNEHGENMFDVLVETDKTGFSDGRLFLYVGEITPDVANEIAGEHVPHGYRDGFTIEV